MCSTILRLDIFVLILGLSALTLGQKLRMFPEGFQFGAATAAYQVEGAWNASDKGESIWDRVSHTPGLIADGASGDVADDSYHLYKRDVEMVRELGVAFYRFSVSWPRLLPGGFDNQVSEDGKRYYNALIDELLKYNITPMITIYHWDMPVILQDLGGWTNEYSVNWFEDYARVVFNLFGDRVKMWITINEPWSVCGICNSKFAFGPAFLPWPGIGDHMCNKNVLLAHARVWRMFDEQYRPKYGGVCGISNQLLWMEPASNSTEDRRLAEEANEMNNEIYSHPIFSTEGGWPQIVLERVGALSQKQGYPRSRIIDFSLEEREYVRGTYDFYGLQHYTSKMVRASNDTIWPLVNDVGVDLYGDPSWELGVSSWFHVYPPGIRRLLKSIKERYNNPVIMITENGYSSGVGLQDDGRVNYYRNYLDQILDAIYVDGVNVTHYTAWSLMDNLEWTDGYRSRFGLYEVDYSDPKRTRTARKSALVYKHIVSTRTLDPHYEPQSLNITIDEKKLSSANNK